MGWLDRSPYRFGTPFSQDLGPIDPRTGLPAQQNPYAPPTAPMAPQAPKRPPAQPAFGQPFQMPQQPAMAVPGFTPLGNGMGTDINPQDASWAAYNPSAAQKPEPQPQPGDQATAGQKDKSQYALGGILGNINNTDLLTLGLSLLGQSQNGGDWGAVAKDLQGIQQGAMSREDRAREIARQKTADEREQEQFDAWRKEQKRLQGMQDRYNAALEDPTMDAESKRLLGIMGPDGYGQFEMWKAEQAARTAETESNRTFTAGENAKDRAARMEEAKLRSANENSFGRYFQAMDAETIGKANTSAAQLKTQGLPQLMTLKENIDKAGEALTGKPLDYNARITLGRWFNGSSPERQSLETWRARILGPALDSLRGLGAMSEREMEAAMNAFSNPDMTLGAAKELIDERIRYAQNKLVENKAMNDFFTEAGGLTGKRNKAGEDWGTYLQKQLEAAQPKKQEAAASAPVAAPKVGEVRDGYRYVGGDPANPNSWQKVSNVGLSTVTSGQPGGYTGR